MGHSQADKAQTHDRIVRIASEQLRKAGIDGVGVADLMKAAGLTVGGFYKHFDSREDLVIEALQRAMSQSREWTEKAVGASKRGPFAAVVEAYLDPGHRDCPETGCAVGALSGDAGRSGARTQAVFAGYVDKTLGRMATTVAATDPARARADAIVAYSAMIGAIGLARAVGPGALSDEILTVARDRLVEMFATTDSPEA